MEQFEKQLSELVTEQLAFKAKIAEDLKLIGESKLEDKEAFEKNSKRLDELQKQADAIDLKMNAARFSVEPEDNSVGRMFTESEMFKAEKASDFLSLRKDNGRVRMAINQLFQRKATITNTSGITAATTGVTVPMRLPGISLLATQELRIRDLMRVREMTTGNAFDYVKQTTRTNAASPVQETSPKAESTYAWESVSDTVKTIAHWVNVSRQALDDVPWLRAMLNDELLYGLKLQEETQILGGDGVAGHMNGIIPQATAYNTGYNVSGDTRIDKLRHAKLQARLAGLATFAPDGIVLNPTDMHTIELIKDENGGANKGLYIVGNPTTGPAVKMLWGLPVVESDSMGVGSFLVGSFGTAAELIDRMAAMVELSYEHASNFTNNIVTVLAEERIGLAVMRPGAFIYGSF